MSIKMITKNRKAAFNYEILEKLEVGVMLVGTEVKSIRAGRINIGESYAVVHGNELTLLNANIDVYDHGNSQNHNPLRTRKLLAHRREINKLIGLSKEKGLTLVPLSVYWKNGKVKIELGIGKGKKLHDKRQTIKAREWDREKRSTSSESY